MFLYLCHVRDVKESTPCVYLRSAFLRVQKTDADSALITAFGIAHSPTHAFDGTQIKDEAFVEDINNILNAGEVRCRV